jgi:hypothetical protein
MAVAPAELGALELARPPIRLRFILAFGLGALALWSLWPRAVAAWRLHALATTTADYALCMVGPTGPSLLRDNEVQFRRLVRRRIVTARADERPFAACSTGAKELTGSVEVERAHLATAWSFVEYGGAAADQAAAGHKGQLGLDDLRVTTRSLAALAQQAWPIVRTGYTRLVKPTSRAKEALHPVEPARPAVGQGLPAWGARYRAVREIDGGFVLAMGQGANLSAYRTRDGGKTFRPVSVHHPAVEAIAGTCPAGDRSYRFSLSADGETIQLSSFGPEGLVAVTPVTGSQRRLYSSACDARALVAVSAAPRGGDSTLHLCHYGARCELLPPPRFSGVERALRQPLDVITILAITTHGVVRVASSRDDGRTWTPLTVAYDDDDQQELRVHARVPSRLLALGRRVLLYAGSTQPSQTYSLLISSDYGASWRTPG